MTNTEQGFATKEEEVDFIANVREGIIPFEEALKQYHGFIWQFINKYDIAGLERDDLYSILSCELYQAILTYDVSQGILFMSYLGKCFVNKLSIEIKHAQRKKHGALTYNDAFRLDKIVPSTIGVDNITYRDCLLTGDYAKEELNRNYFYECLHSILQEEGGDFQDFITEILINEKTLREVGEKHGISGDAVRQRYVKYLGILKRRLMRKGITSVRLA